MGTRNETTEITEILPDPETYLAMTDTGAGIPREAPLYLGHAAAVARQLHEELSDRGRWGRVGAAMDRAASRTVRLADWPGEQNINGAKREDRAEAAGAGRVLLELCGVYPPESVPLETLTAVARFWRDTRDALAGA